MSLGFLLYGVKRGGAADTDDADAAATCMLSAFLFHTLSHHRVQHWLHGVLQQSEGKQLAQPTIPLFPLGCLRFELTLVPLNMSLVFHGYPLIAQGHPVASS